MQEKSKSQQKQPQKFVCSKNKQANFCCAQPTCNKLALKCINSNQCQSCGPAHRRCPRQIRIDKIFEKTKQKAKKCPANSLPINFQDLLQRLIDQLTRTRKQFLDYNIRYWGLSMDYANLLFKGQVKDKTSRLIAQVLDNETIFPESRFYIPPQFKKDVQCVQRINNQLRKRIFGYFECYKLLAQSDCQLKALQKIKINNAQSIKSWMDTLREIHQKFRNSIINRLKISNKFGGQQHILQVKQIQDYHIIGKKLFNLTYNLIQILYKQKRFKQTVQYINLCFDLFNQDRKQFALDIDKLKKMYEQLKQKQAYCAYHTRSYQICFDFFQKYPQDKLTKYILQIMIESSQQLGKQILIKLKYLLLLYGIQNNTEINIRKILQCYNILGNQQKIYQFSKILNALLNFRNLSLQEKILYLERVLFIITWDEKHQNNMSAIISIKDAIDLIRGVRQVQYQHLLQYQLKLRYQLIILQRYLQNDYYNTAKNAFDVAQKQLDSYQKQKQKHQIIRTIKQYLIKYYIIYTQGIMHNNHHMKPQQLYRILQKSIQYCQQLRIKMFQPYYLIARLSNDYQMNRAYDYQRISNSKYPTSVCYYNLPFMLYKSAMEQNPINRIKLNQCIQNIQKSLLLKHNQPQLLFLRAFANHNLQRYRQSNPDLQACIKNQYAVFHANKKIAQNNQLIAKTQANTITQGQKNKLITQALNIYEKCLIQKQDDNECRLGYARVLKLTNRHAQAQQQFNKLLDSQFRAQAYMFLGNIRQQQAKANDDRDFDMLDQALDLYLKAGKLKQNKDNVVRIYKELDLETKAQQVEKQPGWN